MVVILSDEISFPISLTLAPIDDHLNRNLHQLANLHGSNTDLDLSREITLTELDEVHGEVQGELLENVEGQWCEQLLSESTIDAVLEKSLGRLCPLWGAVFVALAFGAILLAGAVGNVGSAVVTFCRRELHSAPYLYVMSLSAAGILMLAGIPFEMMATFALYPFPLPELVCILRHLVCECGCYASALTVTAFSVDRFLAVRTPVHMFLAAKRTRVIRICAAIWLLSIFGAAVFSSQFGILYIGVASANCTIRRSSHCTLTFSREIRHSFEASSILAFLIPGIMIAVLHVLIIVRLRTTRSVIAAAGESTKVLKVTFPKPNLSHYSVTPTSTSISNPCSTPTRRSHVLFSYSDHANPFGITIESSSNTFLNTQPTASIGCPLDTFERKHLLTIPSRTLPIPGHLEQSPILHRSLSSKKSSGSQHANYASRTRAPIMRSLTRAYSESSTSNELRIAPSDSVLCPAQRNHDHRSPWKIPRSVIDRRVQSANRVLVSVCVTFLICWAPFHMQRLLARYWNEINSPTSSIGSPGANQTNDVFSMDQESVHSRDTISGWQIFAYYAVGLLYYGSAAINPILYNVMSRDFRLAFLRMCRRTSRHISRACGYEAEQPGSPAARYGEPPARSLFPLLHSHDYIRPSEFQTLEF